MHEHYRTVLAQVPISSVVLHYEQKVFCNKFCLGIWLRILCLPLYFYLFLFNFFFHSTFFHICFNYDNFGKKIQYLSYVREGAQNQVLHMLIENILWHTEGDCNLNRTFCKKWKNIIWCSVLQFFLFFIKLSFCLKLLKLLFLVFITLHTRHLLF